MNKWKQTSLGEFIDFNPPETILKGKMSRKIPMDKLGVFQRKINGSEYSEYSAGPKFRNGDTLVAKITPCLENGKTAFVDILDENEIAFGSSEFIVLRENEHSDKKFIYYLARSPLFREKAISCMEGTSGRKRVNEGALKRQEILVPVIPTQQKIASVLSALDDKIELNNKINAELEAMAKMLYNYWFVQFDFPSAEGKPYKSSGGEMVYDEVLKREIPKGWEMKSLLDIANFINGLACQKYRPLDEDFLPVIKIREMNDGISANTEKVKRDIHAKYIINDGDVLFSWSASLDVKIWSGGIGGLNQHIFKVTSSKYPKSYYYFELLNYLQHFKMMAELRKTTMGHITQEHLRDSKITVPGLEVINKLDDILNPIFEKILINKKQNQELASLRDWLLPMLMNGQVTVKDAFERVERELGMVAEGDVKYGE
ncbi:restriction endonuclease subunit S [Pedobacter insulae]|uniref:Type I restriction enzyme, S subunit n=1 Tax=Pedobacter insulae TaxID=414048 RepID=A0A1I3AFT2_9SPHI|nr:restriction endonuclease subunit S [Pedobacter insulae]SFH48937.1 type I restriction enzyme, S subunit [Pedobacter insulae]